MRLIRIRKEAENDIENAAAWYETQQAGLGKQFLDEILNTLKAQYA